MPGIAVPSKNPACSFINIDERAGRAVPAGRAREYSAL